MAMVCEELATRYQFYGKKTNIRIEQNIHTLNMPSILDVLMFDLT